MDETQTLYPDFKLDLKRWANFDPKPSIDMAVIESRIAGLRRNVEYLEAEAIRKKPEEILVNYKETLAMEKAIHRAVEAMLDVCRHLVSVHTLGVVESYGEYPSRLAQHGHLPKSLAEGLSKLAGLRNILIHRYLGIDYALLHETARKLVEEIFPDFMEWAKKL